MRFFNFREKIAIKITKKFHLTNREIALAAMFAIMGFAFSSREFLLYLDTLTPFTGLLVYYVILYASIFVLSRWGLIIFDIKIGKPLQVFGLLLITAAFFIAVNFSSQWINIATRGVPADVSNILFQSEDGAAFFLWSSITQDAEVLRILTYVVSPALLALVGGILIREKAKL